MKTASFLCLLFIATTLNAQDNDFLSWKRYNFKEDELVGFGITYNLVSNGALGYSGIRIRPERYGSLVEVIKSIDYTAGRDIFHNVIQGNEQIDIKEQWLSVNLAPIITIDEHYAIYFGIGFSIYSLLKEYRNIESVPGIPEKYWYEEKSRVN